MRKLNPKKVLHIKQWNNALYKSNISKTELLNIYYNMVDNKEHKKFGGLGKASRALWACIAVGHESNGRFYPGHVSEAIAFYKKHIA